MANQIEYAKVFQKELDKQIIEGSTSGWMEENASQVIYNGGDEIKIPKITLNGLGTYNRTDGNTTNPITYTYETRVLSMDRGKRLRIDALDVDETGFGLAAANIAAEFQRVKVIPEIDSYRYSTLSKNAAITKVYTPDKKTILSTLLGQLGEVREVTGGEGELVIAMSRPVYDMIMLSSEVTHSLDCGNFSQGELEFSVKTINGVSIIPVPSARMKTDYVFDSADGFSPRFGREADKLGNLPAHRAHRGIKDRQPQDHHSRTEPVRGRVGYRLPQVSRYLYPRQQEGGYRSLHRRVIG